MALGIMLQFVNQYSFVILMGLLVSVISVLSWRLFDNRLATVVTISTIVLMIAIQSTNTTKQSILAVDTNFDSVDFSGVPTVLLLYSNLCVACLAQKPAFSRFEQELDDQYQFVKFDIGGKYGRHLREMHNVELVPTLIVLNKYGKEIWRTTGKVPKASTINLVGWN